MNFLNGFVVKEQHRVAILCGHEKITLSSEQGDCLMNDEYFGKEVIVGVRPEKINLTPITAQDTKLTGVIDVVELMGAESYIHVKTEEEIIIVRVNGTTPKKVGESIDLYLTPQHIHIFDGETEERIL